MYGASVEGNIIIKERERDFTGDSMKNQANLALILAPQPLDALAPWRP